MVEERRGIRGQDGTFTIGALTSQREAEVSAELAKGCPLIPEALRLVGHVQTPNRETVGGSIAHADPSAELPAVALALEAEMLVRSVDRERAIRATDFFQGPFFADVRPCGARGRTPTESSPRGTPLELVVQMPWSRRP